ncbi:ROK family protein [Egicoccus sp. AB-alg2]|uniref:ROK family transcriptional regulator n=1 Tax=Egicoccus sp. AB-alg2 TaxID=3242693 RepID=UPI00359E2EAC
MGELLTTTNGWPTTAPGSPGHLLQLLREGAASTRPQLVELSGISRTAVSQRVDALLAAGLVVQDGAGASTGGRPAVRLRFNHDHGLVLVADLGATHARLAVTDLAGELLVERAEDRAIAEGPGPVLDWVRAGFEQLLDELGRGRADVRGIGIGLPGPVEHGSGRAVSPPIMPGWDGYPVPAHFADYDVPVLVDNDVNIMALGEYWAAWRHEVDDLLFIKVGTGIGCGVIASGRVHRGAQGAAGDLGHVRVPGADDALCRCGNTGCVEAVAGGQAIAERLRSLGSSARDARDVVNLVLAGDREATRAVREAGRELGAVLAAAVNFFNPAVIVIGGDMANAHEQLLAGVREVVYRRSLPLATRHLRVVPAQLGDRAGITGASAMVLAEVLAPGAVDRLVNGVT